MVQETACTKPRSLPTQQEQEESIQDKDRQGDPSAPWAGYNNEEELKEKITALSEDKRNVLELRHPESF